MMSGDATVPQKLATLPDRPGCYLFKDEAGKVLYVGKALSLRSRVRQYFQEGGGHSPRIRRMTPRVREIETIVTDSEMEALILEANLIKRYRPHYNVRLRDDKQYPYICLTMNEPFPRPIVVRRMKKDGNRYFGPYTDSRSMRQTLKLIQQLFQIRTCARKIEEGDQQRVCLDFHMKLCSGPCASRITRPAYRERVEEVCQFLEGRHERVMKQLQEEMEEAAEAMQFERAARIRDQIRAVERVIERQKIVSSDLTMQDVVALATDDVQTCAQVFFLRQGRLVGQEHRFLEGAHPEELPHAMGQFLQQFYAEAAQVPREILLSHAPEEQALLEAWLSERRGGRVSLLHPQRGEKRRLVELAATNAGLAIEERKTRIAGDQAKAEEAMLELQEQLGLPNMPYRIEAYDISNTQGTQSVAAMVVFEGGQPKKSDYRKFKIRSVEGPDDFASMQEVVRRRLERAVAGDEKFGEMPDLLLIDGGKGQLNAVLEVEQELGVEAPTVGLAKQFEEIFLPGRSQPVRLPRNSPALFLLQRIRDEAHRFGLTYHRKLRSQRATRSALDEIQGVGRKRRESLLKQFGSVEAMKQASIEDLARVEGMTRPAAEQVYRALHDPPAAGVPGVGCRVPGDTFAGTPNPAPETRAAGAQRGTRHPAPGTGAKRP